MALIGCERCGRTEPPKIDQKVAPSKKLLYFYKAAPGHRWHVKKKENFEEKNILGRRHFTHYILLQFEVKTFFF